MEASAALNPTALLESTNTTHSLPNNSPNDSDGDVIMTSAERPPLDKSLADKIFVVKGQKTAVQQLVTEIKRYKPKSVLTSLCSSEGVFVIVLPGATLKGDPRSKYPHATFVKAEWWYECVKTKKLLDTTPYLLYGTFFFLLN